MRRLALLFAAALQAQDVLYLATVAAAGASLRLHETADAKRWLGQAPQQQRHWEWHYLQAQANQASAEFQAHEQQVTSVAFSPNGKLMATTSSDKTLRLWSTQTQQLMHECKGHTAAVWSAAFSPDSERVVTGASDGTIRIWSVPTGTHWRNTLPMAAALRPSIGVPMAPPSRRHPGSSTKALPESFGCSTPGLARAAERSISA